MLGLYNRKCKNFVSFLSFSIKRRSFSTSRISFCPKSLKDAALTVAKTFSRSSSKFGGKRSLTTVQHKKTDMVQYKKRVPNQVELYLAEKKTNEAVAAAKVDENLAVALGEGYLQTSRDLNHTVSQNHGQRKEGKDLPFLKDSVAADQNKDFSLPPNTPWSVVVYQPPKTLEDASKFNEALVKAVSGKDPLIDNFKDGKFAHHIPEGMGPGTDVFATGSADMDPAINCLKNFLSGVVEAKRSGKKLVVSTEDFVQICFAKLKAPHVPLVGKAEDLLKKKAYALLQSKNPEDVKIVNKFCLVEGNINANVKFSNLPHEVNSPNESFDKACYTTAITFKSKEQVNLDFTTNAYAVDAQFKSGRDTNLVQVKVVPEKMVWHSFEEPNVDVIAPAYIFSNNKVAMTNLEDASVSVVSSTEGANKIIGRINKADSKKAVGVKKLSEKLTSNTGVNHKPHYTNNMYYSNGASAAEHIVDNDPQSSNKLEMARKGFISNIDTDGGKLTKVIKHDGIVTGNTELASYTRTTNPKSFENSQVIGKPDGHSLFTWLKNLYIPGSK